MSDYDDVDDLMYVKEEKKTGPMKQFLKVLGCWSMSVHEAVILGSVEFVERSIRQVVRSGRILTPEAIDEYDVSVHMFCGTICNLCRLNRKMA